MEGNACRQRGFTLIELIVTTGIMVMILAAVTITGGQTNAERQLKTTAETVRQAMYRARALALAPDVGKQATSVAYCFSLTDQTNGQYGGYKITEVDSTVRACDSTAPVIDHETFPSGIAVTADAAGPDIIYAIDGYADITLPDPKTVSSLQITFRQTRISDPVIARLTTATGQVELCQGTICE